MSTIIHLLGNTGAGKTTFMDHITSTYPQHVAGISVGRELRKMFPPDYFQGQAAPTHTEELAMKLYADFVHEHEHLPLIIVDGQPRKTSQVEPCLKVPGSHHFWLFHAEHSTRELRLRTRDAGDAAKMDLALQRLDNDYRNQYEVMIKLAELGQGLLIVKSEQVNTTQLEQQLFRVLSHA